MEGGIQNEEEALAAPLPSSINSANANVAIEDDLTLFKPESRPETLEQAEFRRRVWEELRTGNSDPDWPENSLANSDVPEEGWPADMVVSPSMVTNALDQCRRWQRMKSNAEEWRPAKVSLNGEMIDLAPLYVSSQGRVIVCDRRYGREFGRPSGSLSKKLNRYQVVTRVRELEKWLYRYRIVLSTFVGEPPEGRPNACHGDGDSTNDTLVNLRWDSQKGNLQDMVRHGRSNAGERNPLSKLDDQSAADIIAHREGNGPLLPDTVMQFARQYQVTSGTIRAVARGDTWRHLQPVTQGERLS